jgi:hypothetical protein
MRKMKRLWISVVLGVLLVATVVGAVSARPNARPVEQAWRVLTVPTSACIADDDTDDFEHFGHDLRCDTGTCLFLCPVYFPAAGEQAVGAVHVKRVTMYAWDNYPAQDVKFWLSKTYPPGGASEVDLAYAVAPASGANPQAVVDTTIANNPIYRVQAPYLWLLMDSPNPKVYGFFIHYTW